MKWLYNWLGIIILLLVSCDSKNNSETQTEKEPESPKQEARKELFSKGEGQQVNLPAADWNEEWRSDNEVIVQLSRPVLNLNPMSIALATNKEIYSYTQAFLIAEDITTLSYKPQVLAALPEVDGSGLVYDCELNTNAKFDDGSAITLQDVVFTLKTHASYRLPNQVTDGVVKNIKNIEVVDQTHFKFRLKKVDLETITKLAEMPILQASLHDENNVLANYNLNQIQNETPEAPLEGMEDWAKNFNQNIGTEVSNTYGAGAYAVTEFSERKIVLTRKENHWLANPKVAKITYKVTGDGATRVLELKQQSIDVAANFSSKNMASLAEDETIASNYHMAFLPSYSAFVVIPNFQKPDGNNSVLQDKHVRQALAHSFAVDQVIQTLSNGNAIAIASFVSVLKDELNRDLKPKGFNLEKADSLLALAGWTDSDNDGIKDKVVDGEKQNLTLELTCQPSPGWTAVGNILVEGLNKAGFETKLDPVDKALYVERYSKSKDFDLILMSLSSSFGPSYNLELFYSKEIGNHNFGGYSNPGMDSLIALAKSELDYSTRKDLLYQIQDKFYEEQPVFFLFTGTRGMLVHKRLGNVKLYSPNPHILLDQIVLSKP